MGLGFDLSFLFFENILQLIGAFIGFSVGYVSHRGYRSTGSPTMLRLSVAFLLLGGGFTISSVVDLIMIGLLPQVAMILSALILGAAALEAIGYFFLAFSHVMSVRMVHKVGLASSMVIPAAFPLAALKSISIYFLLYGVLETVISYFRARRLETLVIAVGLSMIALAEFIRWTSLLYPASSILLTASITIKIIGFFTLYIPVVKFASMGSVKQI